MDEVSQPNMAGPGSPEGDGLIKELAGLRDRLDHPYAAKRMDLVARAGEPILRGRSYRSSPALAHFAFWTRPAALRALKEQFERGLPQGCSARPIGLVFHLPPQNVETVFLYSWVLSYLVGNANVVRLPSSLSSEMSEALNLFQEELQRVGDGSQRFLHYPSESHLGAEISAVSDARVVWGGDAKIAAYADVPLRAGGKALWFGDRFSFSVISGEALAELGDGERAELAARFANDVFVFDQMACASPHALYVVGGRDQHEPAVKAFFSEVSKAAAQAHGAVPTGQTMIKLTEAFASAGRGDVGRVLWSGVHLIAAENLGCDRLEARIGGGYLEYRFVPNLDAVSPLVREADQTMTYFGFSRPHIAGFVGRAQPGLTRAVPFGQALDFSFVWDGYDFPRELTRLVRVS